MVDARSIYRLVEGFTLWDNSVLAGPWRSPYSQKPQVDPASFSNAVEFSLASVEKAVGPASSDLKALAPVLYLIGPVYAMKALSELDVSGFSSSKAAPKGLCQQTDLEGVIDRYKTLAVWMPLLESSAKQEPGTVTFESSYGPSLQLDRTTLDCRFQYDGWCDEKVLNKGKSMRGDALRVVDLLLRNDTLPADRYLYVERLLSQELSGVLNRAGKAGEDVMWNAQLQNVVQALRDSPCSKYEIRLSTQKLASLSLLQDGSVDDKEKSEFARLVCGLIAFDPGYEMIDLFRTMLQPAVIPDKGGGFTPAGLLLVPDRKEDIGPYFSLMRSAFDAVYPSTSFPLLQKIIGPALERVRIEYADKYPEIVTLDPDSVRKSIKAVEQGIAYIDVTDTISDLGLEDLSSITTDKQTGRILMNVFGEEEKEVRRAFASAHVDLSLSIRRGEGKQLLKVKKTKHLN